jgi:murein DD-endopeptidase MepM/ murein hydrolase activator NlpD
VLLALIAAVLGVELAAALSERAVGRPALLAAADGAGSTAAGQGADQVALAMAPVAVGPIGLAASGEPVEPAFSRPVELAGPFQAVHRLTDGETLGAVARRYGVSLESLVWANGLEGGDALVIGQPLRVPRVPGLPYVVAKGDTAATVAERFGVTVEAIASLPTNSVGPALQLVPGSEIFIPGARGELPADWLSAIGGLEGLGARRAELAGVVRAEQTNVRTGPSTEHPRLVQLDAGRRAALLARNGEWVEIAIGAVRGWIRADMLDAPADRVAALPVSNDFPEPPPRWVWPASGTFTSGFGPRWRSFHNGIDIANRAWSPIVAARSGVVEEAGWCSGYGYCVKIRHGGGVETIYGHLIDRPVVSRGDEVSAGELIGHMGSTYDRAGGGYSTGVHLHFTVLVNGKAVNPLRFLP